jgi:hypothetical protein
MSDLASKLTGRYPFIPQKPNWKRSRQWESAWANPDRGLSDTDLWAAAQAAWDNNDVELCARYEDEFQRRQNQSLHTCSEDYLESCL